MSTRRTTRSKAEAPTSSRSARSTTSSRSRKVKEERISDVEEEEALPPKVTRSKASSTSQSKARTKKSTAAPPPKPPNEEDYPDPHSEQTDEQTEKSVSKSSGKKRVQRGRVTESDGDEVESVEGQRPEAKEPTPHSAPTKPTPPTTKDEKSSSEEEDLIPQASIRSSVAPPSRYGRGSVPPVSRIGHSFLAPSTPLPIPEETEVETGPKSRLVIHKMALVNFKSYKGRQEIGPFHKSFSAIVGPNGSGKSNTIDALLFVFGYRANKMRQGKLSELIHNSTRKGDDSDDESELDSCSVEVHFREIIDHPGPDDYEVVSNSKLVIARTAYRSNKSEYTINGKPSNFTEVTTLLKARGIDLDHKRFLILQGEVESIAQMKPKAPSEHEDGLLEYLEDIIGTSKYKAPIEAANEEVDKLNEERGVKLNRLRLVEKEKSRLETAKREVEDALRDHNALMRAHSALAQYYVWQSLKNVDGCKREIAKLEARLTKEIEKNKDNIAETEALQAEYKDREAQYEVVRNETAKLVKDLAAHEKEEVKLQEKKKHVATKHKKLKKSIVEDGHAKNEAESTVETFASQLKKRKREIDALEVELAREEEEMEVVQESLKGKTEGFQRQIEAKQKELAPWMTKVTAKQAEIDVAENERALLAEKAAGAQNAVQDAIKDLEALRLTQRRSRRNIVVEQTEKLRLKATGARQKVEEAKASQAASTSQNAVLDSLNRLRAAGRIQGFHGRLGSLGTISEKYDVAISTACPSLNHLVVDTVEQGQACIEYLRKQNVGRASFIVLEKLPADGRLNKIPTPENVPRLFDLVSPKDPKFATAFFKGLGNTLVANDLDQANRIAYGQQKRWRVVTLAGQVFDTSGTMSGGGTKVARGGMSSKLASDAVEPAVLKKYETDSAKFQQELEEMLSDRRQVETDLESLLKQIPKVDMSISKVELDIQTAKKRMNESERRIKELDSQTKPNASDVQRIKILEAEIQVSTSELEKLREKSGVIDKDISALQDKILEIGGVRLRTQKAKVDGLREQIDHINDQITKAEVGKTKAARDAEKLATSIASATESLQEVESELEALEEDLELRSQDLARVRAQVEEAQRVVESAKDDLAEMKAELDEKMEQLNEFRAKEMEIKQALQDKTKALHDNEAKVQHWNEFHDKLELHEIDEDEDQDEEPTPKADDVKDGENSTPVKTEVTDDTQEKITGKRKATESNELEVLSEEMLAGLDLDELKGDVAALEERVKSSKPNMGLLEEYRKREVEFLDRAKDLEDTTAARDAAKSNFDQLRNQRLDEFMSGFNAISSKLKEMYQMITLGGNAELELVDSLDPFSEGIIFSVMPPKKSWKNISNLSGGEKTLSSLALVFALHVFKPTPLYFMDEIDAALDFRNVSIVANYIKDRTKNAQFIIISLRNDMFELSHRLIGIYKTSNATRSVSIDNHVLTPSVQA
ncbi:uncharacterized protein EI90DRAFT_3119718 [Cantharellus anzutake]|uniref:uncharacterized protein n=1 Tax=Cantharellus anzutake TaxID=1750568 RepID=UPI0019067FEC|nr:uncharacterized protein EI90DRAFT_3119718 [Cantharellus anzutake]KAF8336456.1 hypothetical protein EI90DRAFT_3119718 [Cantharellus anzutake]